MNMNDDDFIMPDNEKWLLMRTKSGKKLIESCYYYNSSLINSKFDKVINRINDIEIKEDFKRLKKLFSKEFIKFERDNY